MKYIAPLIQRGDITVIAEGEATNWKESAARAIVESALEQTDDIAAILAPNDDTARGVIAALSARGLVGKVPVTGPDATADALERIFTGQQSITIYKDTRMLAQKAVQTAVCLMRGAPLPADSFSDNVFKKVPTYTIPVTYIDRDMLTWFLRLPDTHN
jgi:D-xylose transport system substrate-binding protein